MRFPKADEGEYRDLASQTKIKSTTVVFSAEAPPSMTPKPMKDNNALSVAALSAATEMEDRPERSVIARVSGLNRRMPDVAVFERTTRPSPYSSG